MQILRVFAQQLQEDLDFENLQIELSAGKKNLKNFGNRFSGLAPFMELSLWL